LYYRILGKTVVIIICRYESRKSCCFLVSKITVTNVLAVRTAASLTAKPLSPPLRL